MQDNFQIFWKNNCSKQNEPIFKYNILCLYAHDPCSSVLNQINDESCPGMYRNNRAIYRTVNSKQTAYLNAIYYVPFLHGLLKMTFGSHAANYPALLKIQHECGKNSHCCVIPGELRLGFFWWSVLGFLTDAATHAKSQSDTFYHVEFSHFLR